MSDTSSAAAPKFSDRELQMLSWAMQSAKAPPEIDYDRLATFAGMTNPRSASNAWAVIKKKLYNGAPPDSVATSPKPKATPKKKAASAAITNGDAEGGDETPKKTPRKRTAPKKAEGEGEDGSPKKRGRKPKKEAADEEDSKTNGVKKEEVSSPKAVSAPEPKADAEGEDETKLV
ncbi:hypothetical protein BDV96DRAFT_381928 [Lophiotrema nucula]|uniref:Uncharacterized protein n=1 Tax=Lophiotrema nucula TaxID=690887 RepID=A0A6A5ZFP5_9PLEO|nr:hypothetical protein BDV96DRAFT_381928 [Lophiotrema nucula]